MHSSARFTKIINIFFASIIFGQALGYGQFYFFHIMLVLLIFSWFDYTYNGANLGLRSPNTRFFDFFKWMLFWYAAGLLWSIELNYTMTYLFYILIGVLIVNFTLKWCNSEERITETLGVVKWALKIQIIVCLLEIFTPFRFPTSPYSSYAEFFSKKASNLSIYSGDVIALIETVPTGFLGNPNNLAVVIISTLPLFLIEKRTIFNRLIVVSHFIILFFTGSRGAFIALLFGLLVYLFMKSRKNFLLALCGTSLVVGIFILNIDDLKKSKNVRIADLAETGSTLTRFLGEKEQSTGSISFRQELIENGMNALWETDGIGVGGGASKAVQEKAGGEVALLGSMHNFWVEILVEAGVLFFITFVCWYVYLAYKLYMIATKSKNLFYQQHAFTMFLILCIFSVGCISASSVIYLLVMWFLFGMSIAIYVLHRKVITNNKYQIMLNK